MKYWLLQKAAYDRNISEIVNAKLDQISLLGDVDPTTVPTMPEFLEQLSWLWEE